ncbi:MAG TPA: HAMP domain-containing sensor histidine kinase [Candidatus Acidoferrales bacterium]|nr:HAMP domain-containing sensor histidine kinase [Candidatus Acidoferrales bacterium]
MDRLGVRLALAIGGAVAVVIVLTGILVNVVVGSRFSQYLTQEQTSRRDEAAAILADEYRLNGSLALTGLEVRQLVTAAGGPIAIYDPSGSLLARSAGFGAAQGGPVDSSPIVAGGQTVGRLDVQSRGLAVAAVRSASLAFRRGIDQTLLIAGLVAVVVSVAVALIMGLRMTRPLALLAAAAHRLGGGDLTTRVPVPTDREGHELALAFNSMAENLQRSEQLRRRAASDLAHEIATPVTVLTTQLDALADGVVPATPDQLAATRETAGEVSRLVGDLHDLAAAEGAALLRSPERVNLLSLATDCAAAVQALYGQEGVALLGPGAQEATVVAHVEPRQVERSLQNLLTNAAVYTPKGGTVRLTVAREGPVARIRVSDTGPGIPPDQQARVFERFYRADPARARRPGQPGGTGIGLTVARELARANGGDVRIESSSPQGTTFVIELPLG